MQGYKLRYLVVFNVYRYIPVTSASSSIDGALSQTPRFIIYNKTDLADKEGNKTLSEHATRTYGEGNFMMLTNLEQDQYRSLLRVIRKRIINLTTKERIPHGLGQSNLLVVGVPNVGKSTVINRLRALGVREGGGQAVKVGNLAGITRAVSGLVRIIDDPDVRMWDTPGVLVPKITDPRQGLKLAITGAIMDNVVGDELMMDYLLWTLNEHGGGAGYVEHYKLEGMAKDSLMWVDQVGRSLGIMDTRVKERVNARNTVLHILKDFRSGKLGRFSLDDISI